jgi:hypothetical protein
MNAPTRKVALPILSRATTWTLEKISALSAPEVKALRENAERLAEPEIAELCTQVLKSRPRSTGTGKPPAPRKVGDRLLVSRTMAFGMRGVGLSNRFWSRSGLTRAGDVVFALWAEDVQHGNDGSRHLLWAPNVDGVRAWSDKPAGQERLEHCRRAIERGAATGLMVYGKRMEGFLPDEKAERVDGADAQASVALRVEKRGDEYWAVWGGTKN